MIKTFTSDLRRNITKIICLTVGLAIGLILVAQVYFVQSFDRSIKDSDRIYRVTESATVNGEYMEYIFVPGAIAPGFKNGIPQVEAATRITVMIGPTAAYTNGEQGYATRGLALADSCFFDVIHRNIMEGDPHAVLSTKDYCMIPHSLAEAMGGNVVGRQITLPGLSPDYKMTIGGVYEDFPYNSTFDNEILVSMKSISNFMHDGSENWVGNDRYKGYVKLAKGVKPEEIRPGIDKLVEEHVPEEAIKTAHLDFGIRPLIGLYTSQGSIKTMSWIMSLLALIILSCSGVNYLLIVVGQISSRSKEMAIRKCYGTSNATLFIRVMGECLAYLATSLALAILLLFCFRNYVAELVGTYVEILLSTGYVWGVEALVLAVLFIVTGIIPAYIYCHTPVSHAFRNNVRNRKAWKIALLSVEFCASGFLICLLSVVGRQFNMVSDLDMGFETENIGFIDISGVQDNVRETLVEELKKIGVVEGVGSSDVNFIETGPGDNIWPEDFEETQVNISDRYYTNASAFDVLGVKFKQGHNFSENADSTINEVVVEERMIDIFKKHFNFEGDDIVGQSFYCTGHDGWLLYTICGVVENMRRGSIEKENADNRSAVFFPTRKIRPNVYVKFTELTPDALSEAQHTINRIITDREVYISPYKVQVDELTRKIREFGKSVTAVGIAILFIALMGLTGYTTDEVQRRAKEIAIRKAVGTSETQVLKMFCVDIIKVAVPSFLAGGLAAYIAAGKWLEQFTEQVSIEAIVFVLCLLALMLIILIVVILNSIKVSRSNPVNYLRNE